MIVGGQRAHRDNQVFKLENRLARLRADDGTVRGDRPRLGGADEIYVVRVRIGDDVLNRSQTAKVTDGVRNLNVVCRAFTKQRIETFKRNLTLGRRLAQVARNRFHLREHFGGGRLNFALRRVAKNFVRVDLHAADGAAITPTIVGVVVLVVVIAVVIIVIIVVVIVISVVVVIVIIIVVIIVSVVLGHPLRRHAKEKSQQDKRAKRRPNDAERRVRVVIHFHFQTSVTLKNRVEARR